MRNIIRCCIACIFPCGAFDVIRIVHANGRVEELSGSNIKAGEIMKAYPKHVLKMPSSHSEDGTVGKVVIVPPEAELRRGKFYFLMHEPSKSEKTRTRSSSTSKKKRNNRNMSRADSNNNNNNNNGNSVSVVNISASDNDQYLTEILSEKVSTQRDRRRGRVGVWRPHLESISETQN